MKAQRTAYIAMILIGLTAHANAQQFEDESLGEVRIRAATVLSSPSPTDEYSLRQERDKISDLLIVLQQLGPSFTTESRDRELRAFTDNRDAFLRLFNQLKTAGCGPTTSQDIVTDLRTARRDITRVPTDTTEFESLVRANADCPTFVALDSARLATAFQTMLRQLETRVTEVQNQQKAIQELKGQLEARQQLIQAALEKAAGRQNTFESLWIILLTLGGLSLASLLITKLFELPVQTELIASGQLIQFVTVMVLLSVILALGLNSTLSENTLGTLLGGIAGYVLSQGVGKAEIASLRRGSGFQPVAPPPLPQTPPTAPPQPPQTPPSPRQPPSPPVTDVGSSGQQPEGHPTTENKDTAENGSKDI